MMRPSRCWAWYLAAAGCLFAASGVWAADPASVVPADAEYYLALDLDAAQQTADQILPQLAQDYWAKSEEPGRMGLAALAAAAPVIHAQLATARSLVGPAMGVAVFEVADLYGAYMSGMLEMAPETGAPKAGGKAARRARPLRLVREVLPHFDVVIAAEIRDQSDTKRLLDAFEARQKHKRGRLLAPLDFARDGPALAVHVADGWVIVATKPERLEQVKAVMAGEQPALSSRAVYQEVVAALPPGGVALVFADVARFGPAAMEHLRKAMEQALAEAEKRKESKQTEEGEPPKAERGKRPAGMNAAMKQYMQFYWKVAGDAYAATRGAGASLQMDRK